MPPSPRRQIPDPGFAGDDGTADPAVSEALARYQQDPESGYRPALAVVQGARLLVPVVAVLGEVEDDDAGRAHDKTSDMATVLLTGADGRTALLTFTGSAAMQQWDPAARPVPVSVGDAARAARQDGADALVVDVAGPVMFVVEGDDLVALADGYALAEVGGSWLWTRAEGP